MHQARAVPSGGLHGEPGAVHVHRAEAIPVRALHHQRGCVHHGVARCCSVPALGLLHGASEAPRAQLLDQRAAGGAAYHGLNLVPRAHELLYDVTSYETVAARYEDSHSASSTARTPSTAHSSTTRAPTTFPRQVFTCGPRRDRSFIAISNTSATAGSARPFTI